MKQGFFFHLFLQQRTNYTMTDNKNNNSCAPIKKRHNPQAYIPAIYFPNWLAQIPISKLSMNAKVVYGRLCQWADKSGRVDRSTLQLCEELGMTKSPMDRALKELRDVGLIGTYQVEKGGVNHFEFYEHEWMNEQINENLTYSHPTPNEVLPHTQIGVTPTPKQVSLKYKSNIINNNINNNTHSDCKDVPKAPKSKANSLSLSDLLKSNPHGIETPLIEEWIMIRKQKRAPITANAWERLNNKLSIIEKTLDFTAEDVFIRMVDRAWLTVEPEWFDNKFPQKPAIQKPAIDDTSWGKDFYVTNQLGF
jgi:predicted transcriptional regulator